MTKSNIFVVVNNLIQQTSSPPTEVTNCERERGHGMKRRCNSSLAGKQVKSSNAPSAHTTGGSVIKVLIHNECRIKQLLSCIIDESYRMPSCVCSFVSPIQLRSQAQHNAEKIQKQFLLENHFFLSNLYYRQIQWHFKKKGRKEWNTSGIT